MESGATDLEHLTYESAPWTGPFDAFPAKTELAFVHGLGVTPELVATYLSFKPNGTEGDSNTAENAGSSGDIACIDANVVVIKNNTCEESFYLRLVAVANGAGSTEVNCLPEQ